MKMSETIRGYTNHPSTKWIILCNIFTCCCFSRDHSCNIVTSIWQFFGAPNQQKYQGMTIHPSGCLRISEISRIEEFSIRIIDVEFLGMRMTFHQEDRFWQIITVRSCPQALLNNDSLTNGLKALAQCLFLSLKTEKRQNDGFDLLQKSLVEVTLLRLIWIVSSITWPTDHHVINIRFHNLAPNIIYIL